MGLEIHVYPYFSNCLQMTIIVDCVTDIRMVIYLKVI